ncbi:MAG: hypothetical protein AB4058_11680 [Microcystaceae cyanobacterium]
MDHNDLNLQKIQEPILTAPPDVRQIIEGVIKIEKEKLYLKVPKNIQEDIMTLIKKVIQ